MERELSKEENEALWAAARQSKLVAKGRLKKSINRNIEYGPCGEHEKYAVMFLIALFTTPIWAAFLYWLFT